MKILTSENQAAHVTKLLTFIDNDPTPEAIHRAHELLWQFPGKLGEENSVVIDFGEYIGTLDDIVNGKYEDDGWLYHFKKAVIKDLDGLIDKHKLEKFATHDHLEIITGHKMIRD